MSSLDSEESSQKSQAKARQKRKNVQKCSNSDDSDSSESDNDSVKLNQFSQMLLQSVQAIGILSADQMKEIVLEITEQTNGNFNRRFCKHFAMGRCFCYIAGARRELYI